MRLDLCYKKKSFSFISKINRSLFLRTPLKNFNKSNLSINISLITYNYIILNKILRQFGLMKPLLNKKDYY